MLTDTATSCVWACLHMKMTSAFFLFLSFDDKKNLEIFCALQNRWTLWHFSNKVWEIWRHAVCEISVYLWICLSGKSGHHTHTLTLTNRRDFMMCGFFSVMTRAVFLGLAVIMKDWIWIIFHLSVCFATNNDGTKLFN